MSWLTAVSALSRSFILSTEAVRVAIARVSLIIGPTMDVIITISAAGTVTTARQVGEFRSF